MIESDHSQTQRALEARQVLDNPVFQGAMGMLRDQVIQQWRGCSVADKEQQLLLLQLAKLSDKFESLLVGLIETGKLAQRRIDIDAVRNESGARKLMRRVL